MEFDSFSTGNESADMKVHEWAIDESGQLKKLQMLQRCRMLLYASGYQLQLKHDGHTSQLNTWREKFFHSLQVL